MKRKKRSCFVTKIKNINVPNTISKKNIEDYVNVLYAKIKGKIEY